MPVREGKGRPFFPYVMLVVDLYSGLVLECEFVPHPAHRSAFRKGLFDLLERSASLPEQVLFLKANWQRLLEPITGSLNITSRVVNRLGAIEDAKKSLFEHMMR